VKFLSNLREEKFENYFDFLFTMLLIVLMYFIVPFIITWAWNYVIPYLFGLPHIDWTKAFALNVLIGFLLHGGKVFKYEE